MGDPDQLTGRFRRMKPSSLDSEKAYLRHELSSSVWSKGVWGAETVDFLRQDVTHHLVAKKHTYDKGQFFCLGEKQTGITFLIKNMKEKKQNPRMKQENLASW